MKKCKPILITLLLLIGPLIPQVSAQDVDKVQAIFIVNFTKYIQWPEGTDESMTVGIFGNSRVLLELEALVAKKPDLKINVIKIASSDEVGKCDIIFVPEEQYRNLGTIEAAVQRNPVLIVTETDEPVHNNQGGIGFYLDNSKLKFTINRGHIEDKAMKVSNNLLGLAKVI